MLWLLVCAPAGAEVVLHPDAPNERPVRWESARCRWEKADQLTFELGDEGESPRLVIRLKEVSDYHKALKRTGKIKFPIANAGVGEVRYTDIYGTERTIHHDVKGSQCEFTLFGARFDPDDALEQCSLAIKCEGLRGPFQRGFEIKEDKPIVCEKIELP